MIAATYLSQEGFEETKPGTFFSREINTTITATMSSSLYDVSVDEHVYKDVFKANLPKAVEYIHKYEGTSRVVALYNLQHAVVTKKILPIKEGV